MPAQWTGKLVGKMHNNEVSNRDLAAELNCSSAYVSMVLNGARNPDGARERFESALNSLIEKKKAGQ